MMIHDITAKAGPHKRKKRVGRGPGSGNGKTAGRGHKGAKSRSGWSNTQYELFEGGQMPYHMRIPKRGFSNARFKKVFSVINVQALENRFEAGDEVNVDTLKSKGLLSDEKLPVKILGEGELTKKLTVTAAKFSASAKSKIEAAGGAANVA